MSLLRHLVDWLNFRSRANTRFNLISMSDKREKSVYMGVSAIIYSLIALVFVAGSAFAFLLLWNHFTGIELGGEYEFPIFTLIGMVFVVCIAIYTFLLGVFCSLVYIIYQFKMNKRAIRFVALVIYFLSIGGMVFSVWWLVL